MNQRKYIPLAEAQARLKARGQAARLNASRKRISGGRYAKVERANSRRAYRRRFALKFPNPAPTPEAAADLRFERIAGMGGPDARELGSTLSRTYSIVL